MQKGQDARRFTLEFSSLLGEHSSIVHRRHDRKVVAQANLQKVQVL